jgi:predicted transposase/invertase (TIGR01784 family)
MHQVDCSVFLAQDNPEAVVLAILCDFQHKDKRQIVREILNRILYLTINNEAQYRDCMLMLEVLSENRDLSDLIKEKESMLSAIKLEDLPSYEIGIEKGLEKGIIKNQIKIVINAKKAGLDVDKIAQITGLSEKEIANILQR